MRKPILALAASLSTQALIATNAVASDFAPFGKEPSCLAKVQAFAPALGEMVRGPERLDGIYIDEVQSGVYTVSFSLTSDNVTTGVAYTILTDGECRINAVTKGGIDHPTNDPTGGA